MNFRKRITNGIAWSGISQVITRLISISVKIILIRLLEPKDFGVMGIALIFLGFMYKINELGLNASIIQKKDITENHLSTCFWLNITMGFLLFLITLLISPYLAIFFSEEKVRPVLNFLSIGYILSSIGSTHRAILEKRLDFKNVAIVEIISEMFYSIAIFFAFSGFGIWSLVIGDLLRISCISLLFWIKCSWRPILLFDLKSFKDIFKFSFNVMGSRMIEHYNGSVASFIIGKFLNSTYLGFYTIAYQMSMFPISRITMTLSRVLFPAFSIIQDNNDKLKRIFLKIIKYHTILIIPFFLILIFFAHDIVPVLFGSKWVQIILPLKMLCIAGIFKSFQQYMRVILYSKGRSDIFFKWNLFSSIVLPVAILIGLQFKLFGIAFSVAAISLLTFMLIQKDVNIILSLQFNVIFKEIFSNVIPIFIIIGTVYILKNWLMLISFFNVEISLFVSLFIGISLYFIYIFRYKKDLFYELKLLIKK